MTATERPLRSPRERRAPRRRRRRALWGGVVASSLLAAFTLGLAVGRALEDNPRPEGDRTYVRTLAPLTLVPERETVTVTSP